MLCSLLHYYYFILLLISIYSWCWNEIMRKINPVPVPVPSPGSGEKTRVTQAREVITRAPSKETERTLLTVRLQFWTVAFPRLHYLSFVQNVLQYFTKPNENSVSLNSDSSHLFQLCNVRVGDRFLARAMIRSRMLVCRHLGFSWRSKTSLISSISYYWKGKGEKVIYYWKQPYLGRELVATQTASLSTYFTVSQWKHSVNH